MSAPVRTAPRPAPSTRTRRSGPGADRSSGARPTAGSRAYTRRTERTRRWADDVPTAPPESVLRRVPFVALVIGLLAVGLVSTLWLSTRSAEDSYALGEARATAQQLEEQAEALRRDVAGLDAAPALAQRAGELGMVPSGSVAHLVVAADGSVALVGDPEPAAPAAAPALPPPAAAPAPVAVGDPVVAPAPVVEPAPAVTPAPAAPGAAPSVTPAPAATPGEEQIRPDAAPAGQTPTEQIVPGPDPAVAGGAR